MKLVESILTKNPCYTAGRKITVKGLMLHSVGCPQPKASAFISSWNSPAHGSSCVHGFIDGEDGTAYQTLPWNHRGWHCGSGSRGSGNNTHIGVEMCEPACIRYTAGSNFTCSDVAAAKAVAERTYGTAVELFAMLCEKYGLDPLEGGVVIGHREGCARGIASNHGDPEHLWAQLGLGYTMDGFRRAVRAAMAGGSDRTDGYTRIMGRAEATAEQMRAYLKAKNPKAAQSVLDMVPLYLSEGEAEGVRGCAEYVEWLGQKENPDGKGWAAEAGYGEKILAILKGILDAEGEAVFRPYLVRVSIPDLNIRKGPGTDKEKTGKYTGAGIFTIVEEADGKGASRWGRLKSGAGWIALDFCERV